jgi:hypothetical protein
MHDDAIRRCATAVAIVPLCNEGAAVEGGDACFQGEGIESERGRKGKGGEQGPNEAPTERVELAL